MNTKANGTRRAVTACRRTSALPHKEGRARFEGSPARDTPGRAYPPHRSRAGGVATRAEGSA